MRALYVVLLYDVFQHYNISVAMYKGGSSKKNAREIFEATPNLALTTPVFDRQWRFPCSLLNSRVGTWPEFTKKQLYR